MQAGDLGQWYTVIFWLPGLLGLLLLLSPLFGHGHGHGGHGHGHYGHGNAAHGHGGSTQHGHSIHSAIKRALGVGSAPLPFVWGSGLLGWAVAGIGTLNLFHGLTAHGSAGVGFAVLCATVGAGVAVKVIAAIADRVMPQTTSYVTATIDLIGQTGHVVFPVDDSRGRVHVHDAFGTLHDVSARVRANRPAIDRGARVLVVDFDAVKHFVEVEPVP